VLVGSQTYLRPWVRYEIMKSFVRGKARYAWIADTLHCKYSYQTGPSGPFCISTFRFIYRGDRCTARYGTTRQVTLSFAVAMISTSSTAL